MKIAIVGTGYVGLVSGTCFAESGHTVYCIDIDQHKIEKLNNGEITIFEPGLERIFHKNIQNKRLHFSTQLEDVLDDVQVVFLALPTPPGEDGSADLRYVLAVAKQLGQAMTTYKVIVDKSTVPVGTSEKVRAEISKYYKGEFDVVSNPEFLREGVAVDDFMKPDRVVIGTESEKARKIMADLYAPFVRQGNPILFMDEKSAELTKYAANSFLATKITFMNEVARVCELVGADIDMVRIGIGSDDRIGKRFLFPGIGYGGSCFPKDVKALIKSSKDEGYDFKILNAVENINTSQKTSIIPKILNHFNNDISNKKVAIWGLAFKPNTDDIREAPALYVIEALLKHNCSISVFDPEAMKNVKQEIGDIVNYTDDMYDALNDADFLIIATEWQEFRMPDFDIINQKLKSKLIFDGRNVFSLSQMRELNYTYYSVGRQSINGK